MPVRIFKQVGDLVSIPMCKSINISFKTGYFPDELKIARITPIHKKGAKNILNNYRPIASLPYMSKIYEKAMANRLFSFLNKFSLISEHQFGFQKKKSTSDALISFIEKNYVALNNRKNAMNVFLDLSKAFDTVDHSILINKLHFYGIRGLPLSWFRSYLNNRVQYVSIGSSKSSEKYIKIGVPQGSILGPILFLIFINDLPRVSNELSYTLFADDTTLTYSHSNYPYLLNSLNVELELINSWTKSNKLTVNVLKTELMLVTMRNLNLDHSGELW